MNTTHHTTGGQSNRDVASMLCHTYPGAAMLAGGPIDAPLAIPAGACDSTSTRRGLEGRPVPAVSLTYRAD